MQVTKDNYQIFNYLVQFYFLAFNRQPLESDAYFREWQQRYQDGVETFIAPMDTRCRAIFADIILAKRGSTS